VESVYTQPWKVFTPLHRHDGAAEIPAGGPSQMGGASGRRKHVVGRTNRTISPLRFSDSVATRGVVFLGEFVATEGKEGSMCLFSALFLRLSIVTAAWVSKIFFQNTN